MSLFEKYFWQTLTEDMTSGGMDSVWGSVNAGATGNQFPSQNDKGYNAGDSRPFNPAAMILGAKTKSKRKKGSKKKVKKVSFPIQRRPFSLA